ncbi:hypothetical protein L873DRAFT_197113 [Choiromyces venosus 120613-1]|uniref:Uncharacterized protein n=1 Tax=Choiromyces venosus 120613-1 TaxID=1336337 RepID=A0A3N4J2L0_9PEZI|nr:hypothetical protein L873DRAFT_197113 [Choiromyces venosus 120613-1]
MKRTKEKKENKKTKNKTLLFSALLPIYPDFPTIYVEILQNQLSHCFSIILSFEASFYPIFFRFSALSAFPSPHIALSSYNLLTSYPHIQSLYTKVTQSPNLLAQQNTITNSRLDHVKIATKVLKIHSQILTLTVSWESRTVLSRHCDSCS